MIELEMLSQAEEFVRQGRKDLALPLLDSLFLLYPNTPTQIRARAYLLRGQLHYSLGTHEAALNDLREALTLDPSLSNYIEGDASRLK